MLRDRVDPRLVARREIEPCRPRRRRRRELGDRRRRRAHEPPGGEHVERPGPLADQVRRRLEPGLPADAAAREERDALVPQVPGRRLGGVARVGVLGQHGEQRPVEVEVERSEDERERRLGHARRRVAKVVGERDEPLVRRELGGDRAERRDLGGRRLRVHDEGRNSRSAEGHCTAEVSVTASPAIPCPAAPPG